MQILNCTASFTRPADTTAYTSGDLVANSVTNTSVVPMTFQVFGAAGVKVWRVNLLNNNATPTNGKFRLHLYGALPTGIANGDNGAWSTNNNAYIDSIDIDASAKTFVDKSYGSGVYINTALVAQSIFFTLDRSLGAFYGLLAVTAAYTPASAEVFTVNVQGEGYAS